MRPYLSLARLSARAVLTYRLNFLLGMFAVFFQTLALLSVWHVLLRSGRALAGFDWPQMKAYVLIAFVTGALVSGFSDFRMAWRIREGLVAIDLTKPLDYQRARFAEVLGTSAVELLTVGAVSAGVIVLSGGVATPGPRAVALFVVSLLAVVPLKFLVVYLTTLLCFWTQNYLGVIWARAAVVGLLSGALVPLPFLPQWLRVIAAVLPFSGLTATPAAVWLERVDGATAAGLVAVQWLWVGVLWTAARAGFGVAVRQLTVHGG